MKKKGDINIIWKTYDIITIHYSNTHLYKDINQFIMLYSLKFIKDNYAYLSKGLKHENSVLEKKQ